MDNPITETIACKNCGHHFEGTYCPKCGQKRINDRITLKDSIRHWLGVMINFDRGLWHTTWMMLKNPGKVIHDYLNGITRPYLHPFRFLFLWLTVQIFFMFATGLYDRIQSNMQMEMGGQASQSAQLAVQQHYQELIRTYMQLFFILGIPGLALGTKMTFAKAKLNFAEHLALNSFAYGASMTIGFIAFPLYFVDLGSMMASQLLAIGFTIAYMAYVYQSTFKGNVILNILKAIVAMLVWFIGFMIIILLFLILYFVYLGIFKPGFIENLKSTAMLPS